MMAVVLYTDHVWSGERHLVGPGPRTRGWFHAIDLSLTCVLSCREHATALLFGRWRARAGVRGAAII